MGTWGDGYRCTDCGRQMDQPGTCNDCIVAHQRAVERIREDLAKQDKNRKGGKRK